MATEIVYAEFVDTRAGDYFATPAPTGYIVPYETGRYDGGWVTPAPSNPAPAVGNPTPVLDQALDSVTYRTPTGERAWLPTRGERELIEEVTSNPMAGLDELAAQRAAGGAARQLDNQALGAIPYIGDIAGGVIDGAAAYNNTGSLGIGVGTGVGSAVGGSAGTALGIALGAPLGPAGSVGGAVVGGALGSAVGGAIGGLIGGLIDPINPANLNDVVIYDEFPLVQGGQESGVNYDVYISSVNTTTGVRSEYLAGTRQGPITITRSPIPDGANCGDTGLSYSAEYVVNAPNPWQSIGGGCYKYDPAVRVRTVRLDGQEDTTSQPNPIPYGPTSPIPLVPKIPFGLPQPINIPDIFVNPDGRGIDDRYPTPDPTGYPNPTGFPNPIDSPIPTGYPTPTSDPSKQPNPYPDPTKPPSTNPNNPDNEDCNICKKLDGISKKLDDVFSDSFEQAISLIPCDGSQPLSYTSTGNGLDGISKQVLMLSQVLTEIWDKVKCPPVVEAALPESWAIKTSKTKPQYVITFGPTDGSRSRWSATIPWPRYTSLSTAIARISSTEIARGDVQLTLQNADNSHSIFNVASKGVAISVMNWVNSMQDGEVVASQNAKITEGMKARIASVTVKPLVLKYFSQGKDSMVPDWGFRFNDDGTKTPL